MPEFNLFMAPQDYWWSVGVKSVMDLTLSIHKCAMMFHSAIEETMRCIALVFTMGDVRIKDLLPTGSEEREVLGVGSIPFAILTSCQDMKTVPLKCREFYIVE